MVNKIKNGMTTSPFQSLFLLKWKKKKMIKLVIEILTGRLLHVEIEGSATLGDLKKEIAKQVESIPIPENRLLLVHSHGWRLMMDDQISLSDYGLGDGSCIYLLFTAVQVQPATPVEEKETGE